MILMGATACSSKTDTKAQADSADTQRVDEVFESAVEPAPSEIPFETKKFEKEKGENKFEVQYPVSGEPELLKAVRAWINEGMGQTYRGSLDDADAFFRHYASQLGNDPDLNEYGGYAVDEFEVEYVSPLVVTYEHTSYIYEGGAHGMGGEYGTTFLRSDGSVFDKDCITSYKPLMPFIVEGLKKYFKVKTDQELLGCLLDVPSLSKLSPPGVKPWITEEGVVFSYTPYEIAPYSSGTPRTTIPYSKIAPYLTEKGKRFFENL